MQVQSMAIKYWEFEDAPLKDKLKSVNVKEVAKIFLTTRQRRTGSRHFSLR